MPELCRIAAVVPRVKPGDVAFNTDEVIACAKEAVAAGAGVVLFPELCLTGATCGDLFGSAVLLRRAEEGLCRLKAASRELDAVIAVGLPLLFRGILLDCAVLLRKGVIAGVAGKYGTAGTPFASFSEAEGAEFVFDGETLRLAELPVFEAGECRFAVCVGSDITLPLSPAPELACRGAQLLLNPAAEGEFTAVSRERSAFLAALSGQLISVIVSSGAGPGESGTDMLYGGRAAIFDNGRVDAENTPPVSGRSIIYSDFFPRRLESRRLREKNFRCRAGKSGEYIPVPPLPEPPDWRFVRLAANPFVPEDPAELALRCRELTAIQSAALARRVEAVKARKLVIGLSGGLDSTWAFLVCVECCKRLGRPVSDICAVTMPGFGTSGRTRGNAEKMAELFGAELRIIPIADAVTGHFADIGHDPEDHNVTYENSQARERTQILMDLANDLGGIVIGTGDLSELAMGWCTYNGDQMAMYGVNGSTPKTLMRHLVTWYAEHAACGEGRQVLLDVVATPVSPELLPDSQHTEKLIGSYDLHDFFLWHTVRYGETPEFLRKAAEHVFSGKFTASEIDGALEVFLRRFQRQQFKRNPMPDGAKAGTFSLSPRGDWLTPSDSEMPLP